MIRLLISDSPRPHCRRDLRNLNLRRVNSQLLEAGGRRSASTSRPESSAGPAKLKSRDTMVIYATAPFYNADDWPTKGSEDTELGVLMGPEVSRGERKFTRSSSLRLCGSASKFRSF